MADDKTVAKFDVEKFLKDVKTTPADPRFPNQNQSQHCWSRYNEWLICLNKTGDEDECFKQQKLARAICPNEWIEAWDEARDAGAFGGADSSE